MYFRFLVSLKVKFIWWNKNKKTLLFEVEYAAKNNPSKPILENNSGKTERKSDSRISTIARTKKKTFI